jgi:leucyl-tRNA synthetase
MNKDRSPYDHSYIEKKWQKEWAQKNLFKTKDDFTAPKFYILDMFPYPSGEGLHVGHPKGYIATDIVSHMKRMQGFNVLHPMGFDAFGLPAENYAIKTKTNPVDSTKKNVARYKKQLEILGFDYDWDREVNTTDPKFYKWTQWIFLKLLEKGLAYESYEPINWCPFDKTGLSNEDIEDGRCERCGTLVEKKPMRQWVLRITDYAERLLSDLEYVDWPESIKESQKNWIGKSEGVNFKCNIKDLNIEVEMFNSVPQTYRAETFTVIAPEHALVEKLVKGTEHEQSVLDFVKKIKEKKATNKFDIDKDLEGIFTGRYIENYAGTGRDLPIWVASYVVADYGTGMVNCSAHDERDFKFAKKYGIPLHPVAEPLISNKYDTPLTMKHAVVAVVKHWTEEKYIYITNPENGWKGFVLNEIQNSESATDAATREIKMITGYEHMVVVKKLGGNIHTKTTVITPILIKLRSGEQNVPQEKTQEVHWYTPDEIATNITREDQKMIWERVLGIDKPIVKNGILTEPKEFKGREWNEVRPDIIDFLVKSGYATRKVNYKLRDWVFSRQRYWGEPIPVLHRDGKIIPVDQKELPVELPAVKSYEPTGTGESPLAGIKKWINVKIGKDTYTRESNTMPQWAGSSWYYLRYMDPENKKALVDKEKEKYWNQVDLYVGGAEHATRHLIYARFWHKFLYDIGVVSTLEPFKRLQHVGLIMGSDDQKMSKRWGNVVNPDDMVHKYGADTLRIYEMFLGPFDQQIKWDTNGILGARRFVERIWKLKDKVGIDTPSKHIDTVLHKTIKKVTEDIESMRYNTAISTLMIALNEFEKEMVIPKSVYETYIQLIAPFAPHITDEIWSKMGKKTSIHISEWPLFDPAKIVESSKIIVIQLNGKTKGTISVEGEFSNSELEQKAKDFLKVTEVKKVIVVPGKLVNIVIA